MRYLVINNQVYDTEKEGVIDYNTRQYIVGINKFDFNKIQKEANTVEGLCDEYLYCGDFYSLEHNGNKNILIDHTYEENEFEIDTDMILNGIYGVIWWREKGVPNMKCIAKMNNKGELELI